MRLSAVSRTLGILTFVIFATSLRAQMPSPGFPSCRVQAVTFDGWKAEQMSNRWETLTLVPDLGGRLMQVKFGGHAYLFVNPKYRGQYIPPSEGAPAGKWFNYGGDKIWPMPEGNRDEQHWTGPLSGPLDDGAYVLKVLSQGTRCAVEMQGPADPRTGLRYRRDITIGENSPEISFHAVMENTAGYPITWSMQSVSQYDLSDPENPSSYNRDFWAYTPVNPESAYLNQFHVRAGLARDPSFAVKNNLFSLHWLYLQNEVWVDSPGGWVALVDGASQFAMVERFHYHPHGNYPGKATVIFYKNGPMVSLDTDGMPNLPAVKTEDVPYYMEAELNSPVVTLKPGGSYAMDTEWQPTRMTAALSGVTWAGAVGQPLTATTTADGLLLAGSFGVFFPGQLVVRLFDKRGVELGVVPAGPVSPIKLLDLSEHIPAPPTTARVAIHVQDSSGIDRGSLGEAWVQPGKGS